MYKAYNIVIGVDILDILGAKKGINIYVNSYYISNTNRVNLDYINIRIRIKKVWRYIIILLKFSYI